MAKKPNVILITIDALRADHLGFMGYEKNVSPNVDTLSKESTVFLKAFSTAPETSFSFPSILTSTYPLDYQGPSKIEEPRILISEIFKKAGFITAAFHSNPYLSEFFGYNQSWDFFEDIDLGAKISPESSFKKKFKKLTLSTFPQILFWAMYLKYKIRKTPKNEIKVRAPFINQIVKDFIDSVKDESVPFFLWVHYMDVHTPYLSKESYYGKQKDISFSEMIGDYVSSVFPAYHRQKALKRFIRKNFRKYIKKTLFLYDQAIECVDKGVGELLDFLKEKELYRNSIICLTADHGDEFLEHGGISHTPKLYNELLHVPLIIKAPQGKKQIIKRKVSLIDLAPTLSDLTRVKTTSAFKGKNLLESKRNLIFHQAGFSEKEGDCNTKIKDLNQCRVACQSEEWKYILDYGTQKEELYNLFKDPKEQNNLFNSESGVISEMRKKIQEFEKENPPLSLKI